MSSVESGKLWLGVDLGGTKILAKLFDSSFKTLGKARKKTRGFQGQREVLERLNRAILAALADAELTPECLGGIGVGVPGPVDQERGMVLEAANLNWQKLALSKILSKEFGCPVVVSNDVDAGVYGEYRFGAAREGRTVLGVFPGTGIGGGCVYNGQMVHGKHITAMEIGHINVIPNGSLCGCGLRGCLETEASRLAISAKVAAAAYRGEAPHLLEEAGTDLAKIRSGSLANAIAKGDHVVEVIVRQAAERLGAAIASAIHLIAPDVVLLGGGLVEALPELFRQEVGAAARAGVMPSYRDSFQVVTAELGDDASVLGAAAWACQTISSTTSKP
jgi:glucokinase